MTVDEAIKKYRETINKFPGSSLAVSALAALFSGVRAHRDYNTLLDEFGRAMPEPSRKQHIKAVETLVLDLAECEEAGA